jgi:hypothetical protein
MGWAGTGQNFCRDFRNIREISDSTLPAPPAVRTGPAGPGPSMVQGRQGLRADYTGKEYKAFSEVAYRDS